MPTDESIGVDAMYYLTGAPELAQSDAHRVVPYDDLIDETGRRRGTVPPGPSTASGSTASEAPGH